MSDTVKEFIGDISVDLLSGFLIGIALYNFAADAAFPMTGVTGIAMIFYMKWGLPIGIMTVILNIPIIVGCFRILGAKYIVRSFKSMFLGTLTMDFVAPLVPKVELDPLLAALFVGVLTGIGYAIIYMRGTSTGGVDFIIMSIKTKRPHLTLGVILFLVDFAVILVGTVAYGSFESMLYGVIITVIASYVVDKMMVQADLGKMCLIVSDNAQKIADTVSVSVDRGSTIFEAKGGYTGEKREVVMCACSNKEMYKINRIVKRIDPLAFTVILESKEVYGEGFKGGIEKK